MGNRRMGRPPAAIGPDGTPEKTSEYPKLTVSIRPLTKSRLDAITTLEKKSAWQVVEEGIRLYFERMPPEDRRMVEAFVKRAAGR